jgi:integrase
MAQIIVAQRFGEQLDGLEGLPRQTKEMLHAALQAEEVRRCTLPEGFRFLVMDDMSLVEPVLLYLYHKCVAGGRIQSVGNTQKAYCDDLYEWWMWVGEHRKNWDEVEAEDLIRYRDTLLKEFSPHTHRRYKTKTIRRRLSTILGFYRWAYNRALVHENLDRREIRQIPLAADISMLAHVDTRPGKTSISRMLPRITDDEPVNAFDKRDLLQVLNALGPMPPSGEETRQDLRPVRDRLVATLQVTTGMRIHEVLSLTKYQLLDLRKKSDDPYGSVKLRIAKTKGLRPRHVLIPHWLLDALHWYIDHEREEAMLARARVRAKHRHLAEASSLFVNGIHANRRDVANPLQPATFMRVFVRVVKEVGLVHREVHRNPITGEDRMATVVDHTTQDLRHTFTVQTYLSRKAIGDSEPWKTLQALLGHAHLSTTVNTYLRSVRVDEARVTDSLNSFFRELHRA